MSREIDERIVEMRFDNQHFEKNVQTSMSTLEKFNQQLQFKDAGKGFDNIDRAAKGVDLSPLGKSAEKVGLKFRALYTIADHELRKIMDSAEAYGKRIVNALTIDPIKTGLQEYETKMNAIQVIQANTRGKDTMDDITAALEELNVYADKTIYNFAQMTSNVGKFTAQGYRAKDAANAVKGLANLAAASGASAEDMARATYQMSQALGGTIRMIDWNSLRNANMATVDLKNTLMDLARVNGIAIDDMIKKHGTFEQTLQEGWLSGSMFTEAMNIYSGIYSEAELKAKGFTDEQIANFMDLAKMAESAATEVKTFTQLFDVLKETAQSGWTQTWELIFGDFDTAKKMFTQLQVYFGDILNAFSDARNMFLGGAFNLKNPWSKIWEKLEASSIGKMAGTFNKVSNSIENATDKLDRFQKIVNDVWRGDYKNSDTGRYDLLKAAGYDSNVIQDLVNKGSNYKLTVEDIEESHKKFGLTLGENSEAMVAAGEAAEVATVKFKDITDEQLKQAGLTKDEIKLYRDLAEEAERTGVTMMSLVNEMSENDGRTMIIDSFKNAWSGLVTILESVRDAWVEVFPPMTSIQLYNIIKGIKEFSEKLIVSEETSKKLTKTFKGLFAVLDIILTPIVKTLELSFKALNKLFKVLNIDLLSITASIGDVIVNFRDCMDAVIEWMEGLKNSENLAHDIATGIANGLGKVVGTIIGWFKTLGSGLQNGFGGVSDNIISGLVNGLWNGLKLVGQVIYELGNILIENICEVLGIQSPSREFANVGENIILGLLEGIKKTFPVVLETIGECALMMVQTINKLIRQIDWGTIFQGVMTALSGVLVFRISGLIKNFGKMFGGIGDIFENIADLVSDAQKNFKMISKGLTGMFEDIGKSFMVKARVGAFQTIAKSLLMLAIALGILALLPKDRLITATAAISVMGVVLGGLYKLLSSTFTGDRKFTKATAKNINSVTLSLIGISAAMLILAKACKDLGSMSWSETGRAITGLAAITGVIAALMTMMKSLNTRNVNKKLLQVVAMTAVVYALAGVVVILSHIDSEKALVSTISLVTLMGSMTVLLKLLSTIKTDVKNALTGMLGLTLMIVPLGAFAAALATLPPIADKEKDILILVGVMAAMTLLLAATAGVGAIYAATSFIAAAGILALALMVGPLWAFAASLSALPPIENKEADIKILMGVMAAMTGILVIVSVFGPLASMGIIALAEMSLFIVAFGAVVTGIGWLFDKFPDLQNFLDSGIPILEQIAYGLGSVISSFGSGLVSSLPEIGIALSEFMSELEGFINGIKMVDSKVLTNIGLLVSSFIALSYLDSATLLKTILTGGKSPFQSLSEGLSELGSCLMDFANEMISFTDEHLRAVERGAEAIKVIAEAAAKIPNTGGVASWFAGDNTIGNFIKMIVGNDKNPGINALMRSLSSSPLDDHASDKVNIITNIITKLATAAKNIPNTGGVASWFAGDNTIGNFIKMIVGNKDKPGIGELMKCLASAPYNDTMLDKVNVVSSVIKSISDASNNLANSGGVASWFAGDNTISGFIKMLIGDDKNPGINALMRCLSNTVYNETIPEKVNTLVSLLRGIADASAIIPNSSGVASWFAGDNTIGSFIKMIIGDKQNPGINALMLCLNSSPYNDTMSDKVSIIVDMLQGIADASNVIPNTGGMASWFTGDNTIGSFIKMIIGDKKNPGINALMRSLSESPYNESMSDKVGVVVDLLQGIADASNVIPNKGGMASWFAGDNTISGFIKMLIGDDKNPGISRLMESLSEVKIDDTTSAKVDKIVDIFVKLTDASAKIKSPKNISTFGKNLVTFADNFTKFTDKVSAIKTEAIEASIEKINELLKLCGSITADKVSTVSDFGDALKDIADGGIDKFIKTITSDGSVNSAKEAINKFISNVSKKIKAEDIKKTFSSIGKYIVEGIAAGIDTNSYLVSDAIRTVIDNAKLAAQDEAEIESPSRLFKNEVGKWICEGISEGITEDTSAEDALRIKMGNLYSAWLDLKKDWKEDTPLPSFFDFAVKNGFVKVTKTMEAEAKAAGMAIEKYVEHIHADSYLTNQNGKPIAGEAAAEAIGSKFEYEIDALEAKKKKAETDYKWSKLSSTFGVSDATENKRKYLNEQIKNNTDLIATYEKQIKQYGAATDTQTDKFIADIRSKMIALKEKNNDYQKQLDNIKIDQATEAAAEIVDKYKTKMDAIKNKLEMADLRYANWVASYPDAKQSTKHFKLFEHLDEELTLLKEQEKLATDKLNEIGGAMSEVAKAESAEYKAAYEDYVRARVDRFNKEEEISNTHEQHLNELEEADDRVRESEYSLWLSKNENASEHVKLARELTYLEESLVDAEEEAAKLNKEYLKILEREEDETSEAVLSALADWNESEKKANDLRNQINENKKSSIDLVEESSDRLRESEYGLWVSENENATDREKLTRELAYLEESIVDAQEDVVKAEKAYNDGLKDSTVDAAERNRLEADLLDAKKVAADLQQRKNDTEESMLDLVKEERSMASEIAKIKYDIWANTEGRDAKDEEKELKQLEYLNEQMLIQNQITNNAMKEHAKAVYEHGENSTEAIRSYKSYLEEVRSLSELKNQILDLEESAADRQKRLKDKQDLAQTEYEDYIKRYEKYYLANGMSKADLEKDAKLVSGYDPNNVVKNITNKTKTAIESITTSVSYQNILTGFSDMGTSYVQAVNEGVTSQAETMQKTVSDISIECAHKLVEVRPFWKAAGKSLVGGLVQGVRENKSAAINAAIDVAVSMLEAAKRALDMNSPSKAFAEIGKYSVLGLVDGLVNNSNLSDDAASQIGESTIESLKYSIRKIADVINSDLDTQPTIRPVLDLSNIRSGTARLNAMVSNAQALAISDSRKAREHSDENQNGNKTSTSTGNTYQFTQNNYSPKALSPTEIYRQTKNQFAAMKEVLA